VVVEGHAGAPYAAGLLALREGALRERAVRALSSMPDVLLVDAAGLDHPRGGGLAVHLGAVLDLPSVGVTDRPLVAVGAEPENRRGAMCPLMHQGMVVGYTVRVQPGVRPLCVSAGWCTSPEIAVEIVVRTARRHRTPQPLREARRVARQARSRSTERP
jgi:deoxyribonuclease V